MSRRLLGWIGTAVAVVLVVVVALVIADQARSGPAAEPSAALTDAPTDTPTVSPSPTPTPSPVPIPASTGTLGAADGDVARLVEPFVAADAAARQAPAQPLPLDEVATGPALEDLEIGVRELEEGGLSQIGAPTVVSAVVAESALDASPATATALVCLDYSTVDVVTASGVSVKDPNAPQRVPTLLEFVQQDGRWLVTNRTFPDDPTC